MYRCAVLLISACLLASCGGSEEAAPPLQNDIMVRSDAQQQLFDLNDLDRAIALEAGHCRSGAEVQPDRLDRLRNPVQGHGHVECDLQRRPAMGLVRRSQ